MWIYVPSTQIDGRGMGIEGSLQNIAIYGVKKEERNPEKVF